MLGDPMPWRRGGGESAFSHDAHFEIKIP